MSALKRLADAISDLEMDGNFATSRASMTAHAEPRNPGPAGIDPTGGPVADMHARLEAEFRTAPWFPHEDISTLNRGVETLSRWSGIAVMAIAVAGVAHLLI